MVTLFRKSPLVCLGISLLRIVIGRIRFSSQYLGNSILMEDGSEFTIFRHITVFPLKTEETDIVFIVRFKFARFSYKVNKIASIIPMLLISGFPGFKTKMYAVNKKNGYWQGMYQWESNQVLEEYKKSFVFKMMNKRAVKSSLNAIDLGNTYLHDFVEQKLKNQEQG